MAPIYTKFEGGTRAEKTRLFGKSFQKVPKNTFLACFFKNFVLSESSENQFARPKEEKKGRKKFEFFFENPPTPPRRENPRSAPGGIMKLWNYAV